MKLSMQWEKLLSRDRYQAPAHPDESQRSVFQRDYDRIVFCSAFRRLQDKTQVHPFTTSDYVRKRLTHSLEVSSVGRSLGYWLGRRIQNSLTDSDSHFSSIAYDISQIVSNACLAHDIGNPPFGHAGEEAIGGWFKQNSSAKILKDFDPQDRLDFEQFEGNAQGFRLLTRLQSAIDDGGLRLTYASLGAFTKYPSTSLHTKSGDPYIGAKKHGYFKEDRPHFDKIASSLGLIQKSANSWCRHPLVYLVEAADDICYNVVDIEDAFKLGRISFKEAEQCLLSMIVDRTYNPSNDENSNIGWLRATAIGSLIASTQAAYESNEKAIMDGTLDESLIKISDLYPQIKHSKALIKERVFNWDRTIMAEISGSQMIDFVLERCMEAISNPSRKINSLILKVIPNFDENGSDIRKVHAVTDYVSGMTDAYLRSTFLKFSGNTVA